MLKGNAMDRFAAVCLVLALVLPPAVGAGCQAVQATGRREFNLFTWDDEVNLGKKAAPEFEKEFGGRIADPGLQGYVAGVGRRIAQVSHKRDLPYTYIALQSDQVNAFALPGGPVYITQGLLKEMRTEGQLAAVLGHETGHVNARHGSTQMSRQLGLEILLSVAGAAAGAGQGAEDLGKVVGALVGLKYSRDMEKEADRIGLDYMVAAGYAAAEMVALMQVFEQMEGKRPPEFLSTHPNPENRIGLIQDQIRQRTYAARGGTVGEADYRRQVLDRLGVK